ncbi:Gfo/Idh/MocA family protein [Deinococcus sp. Marseille-Q6407]|uniref:Gfo/Idh/MocA family protein n=1 Tax=Deinococcus sp. Marseille-Q6407 TaxID=2969223 RepID=UPI0021BFF953|nr:Gfo/Idh/MocA family oxidoreductase [Deinococcus sp. Marseille-Q6407]
MTEKHPPQTSSTASTHARPDGRIGYAIVGVGQLTQDELIPSIRESDQAYLAALVTSAEDKAEAFEISPLRPEDIYAYEDFEQLADRGDIQAVYIVLPNALHREYVERAARMGKHVLCEKPLASTPEDAKAMVQSCREAGVLLMTAYRCQYTPHHWAVRDAVQRGELGPVRLLNSVHSHVEDDPEAWRLQQEMAGGGPLPDIGLYSLNTVRFVLGQEPLWVEAALEQPQDVGDDPRFQEVERSISFRLGFAGGVLADCQASYAALDVNTFRVLGELGHAALDPAFQYNDLDLTLTTQRGQQQPDFPEYDQFTLEMDHFAQCIRSGAQPWTPGEEGVQDQRLMAAIYESARQGRRVELDAPQGRDVFRGTPPEVPGRTAPQETVLPG